MKNFLLAFFVFLLWALFGMWYHACHIKGLCVNTTTEQTIDLEAQKQKEALAKKAYEDSIAAMRLKRGLLAKNPEGNTIFNYPSNFCIHVQDSSVYIPEDLIDFSSKIASYMGTHQNEELIIEGLQTESESKKTPSYGQYRAQIIKNLLVDAGINGDKIITKAKTTTYTYEDDGKYHGGILLNFNTLDTNRLAEVEKGIANKTLYCDFGQSEFKPDATLTNYTLELKNYLIKYPNKKVTIIGHTDDVGDPEDNLWIGQQRAKYVLKYLASQGIVTEKLTANSKGETSPILPNTSKENRAKNRRIEIIVN